MNITVTKTLVRFLGGFHFRGKMRLMEAVCPREGEYQAEVFGSRVSLDLSDAIQRYTFTHCYEPQDSAVVRAILREGMTFIDAGANIGYFTLLAASCVGPTGRVLAMEPSPYANQRLAKTIRENMLSQVAFYPVGLGEDAGRFLLYVPNHPGNHSPSMAAYEDSTAVSVQVMRLDNLLRENNVQAVDLMKIDVEGFEPNILRGAGTYFTEGKIRAIFCEFNEHWLRANGSSAAELRRFIESHDYQQVEVPKGTSNLLFVRE